VLAGAAFGTRNLWLPGQKPQPVGLHSVDQNGQLLILWDGSAATTRNARSAALTIADGASSLTVPLTAANLQAGRVTYARKAGQVEMTLAITLANGQTLRESARFAGALPASPAGDEALRQERDELARENRELKASLAKETARANRVEKQAQY